MITDKVLQQKLKRTWGNIVYRCTNLNDKRYIYYKSKGICPEWLVYSNFERDMLTSFVKHIVKYGVKETTIDRVNNELGYYPQNCRWATWKEQRDNSSNKKIPRMKYICKFCRKEFIVKKASLRKYCGLRCYAESYRKWKGKTKQERWRNRNKFQYANNLSYRERRKAYQRKQYLKRKLRSGFSI